eukprot:gene55216-36184_t
MADDDTEAGALKKGHLCAHIVAIDIFTDKKMEELCPTSHNMEAPVVQKVMHDGFNLPPAGDGGKLDVRKMMIEAVDAGEELFLFVTAVSAMGETHILEAKKGKGD